MTAAPGDDAVVGHLGLCTADLDRSARFYTEVFGFEEVRRLDPPDDPTARLLALDPPVGLTAVYLRLGSFTLELLHYRDAGTAPAPRRVMNEPGLTHLSFHVADLDATRRRVRAAGGTVLDDTDVGPAVFVRDPDGQLIEVLATRPTRDRS